MHDGIAHYPQGRLNWQNDDEWMPNSQVLLSQGQQVSCAVVFVHGWGGDGRMTWEHFPEILASLADAAQLDAFFVEYPSREHTVVFCAAKLRQFFYDLVDNPVEAILKKSLPTDAAPRPLATRYERIVVVAHSMGAVISRRALLDLGLLGLPENDLKRFRLLFFAPAHCGSNIARLISSGFGLDFLPGARLVGEVARWFMPSLSDLEPGSQTLTKLVTDARAERQVHKEVAAYLCAKVYHAQGDKVVEQNDFEGDCPLDPVMRRDHRSICKPDNAYLIPAKALSQQLSDAFEATGSQAANN